MTIKTVCNNCQIIIGAGLADSAYTIISYDTPVLAIDCSGMSPRLRRLWKGYSVTTLRHINKALDSIDNGRWHISKADWDKMEVESL